ncbi:MAG TPA: ABC transporter ATP-binding protein, partial [Gaiellaceae bacterium]|nr:ABC transporter ATP-binding protein [Gaiellaceae bacterium]
MQGVTVVLGGKPVVDGIDASVAEGEWLALIGPNGAGKTTLLRAVARLVPYTGLIEIGGRSIEEMRRSELSQLVAVVPQEPATPPWMTVAEYVLLGRTPHL